jgi:predicted deacylase
VIRLQSTEIQGSSPGPHVIITGGVHGDEFEPMAAIRQLRTQISREQLRGTVTLVPVVNESAFRRGNRVGDDGLDLARTCPGRIDGSVTEQTAFALSELINAADFYIDLHTGGTRLQVAPMTGYTLHPSPKVLDWQRKMAVAFGLPIIWGTDYRLNGRSLSVARDAEVPAIYAEYLGGGGCDPAGVAAYVAGCLNVLGLVGCLSRPAPNAPPQLIVEDDRPNAGYMQINYNSPIEGFFEPAVKLKQPVVPGQPLGTVSDPLGNDVRTVLSTQTGLVLTLHTFSRVDAGECLGVILETETKETR